MTLFCVARISSAAAVEVAPAVAGAVEARAAPASSTSSSQRSVYQSASARSRSRRGTRPAAALRARLRASGVGSRRVTAGSRASVGSSPDRSRTSASERPRLLVGLARARSAWTWVRTRSSLARSSRGGPDLARDHQLGPPEEVLVVRAAGGAVGEDERGLAAAAGAAGALGVVGRRRRHVAHVDDVELGDVDAELHRRRAEQDRQARRRGRRSSRSSRSLGGTWAVCSRGVDALAVGGDLAVEARRRTGWCAGPRSGARSGRGSGRGTRRVPSPATPAHRRRGELVAGHGARLPRLRRPRATRPATRSSSQQLADDQLACRRRVRRWPVSASTSGRAQVLAEAAERARGRRCRA